MLQSVSNQKESRKQRFVATFQVPEDLEKTLSKRGNCK